MHQPTAPLRRPRKPSSAAALAPLDAVIGLIATSVVLVGLDAVTGPSPVALGLSATVAALVAAAIGLYTIAANQYVALAQPARIEPVRTRGIKEVF